MDKEINIDHQEIRESEEEDCASPNLSALEFFYLYFHVFSRFYDVHEFHYVLNLNSRVLDVY